MSRADSDPGVRHGERQFVGAVCASLSHEIKNCLAIINENAGLMGDLALMAGQGRPVDPERQARIAAAVQKQVRRADQLVVQLNRFAHSGDVDRREVDLADTLTFAAALFERTASKAGKRVTVAIEAGLKVDTAPMGLLQLLWGVLLAGVEGEAASDLVLTAAVGNGVRILISPPAPGTRAITLPQALGDLASALGGTLSSDTEEGVC